jgi:hypothetical protein
MYARQRLRQKAINVIPHISLYRKNLDEELSNALTSELLAQTKQTFDKVVETDWRLTQHNFLLRLYCIPWYFFKCKVRRLAFALLSVGVVASGAIVRVLVAIYGALH